MNFIWALDESMERDALIRSGILDPFGVILSSILFNIE